MILYLNNPKDRLILVQPGGEAAQGFSLMRSCQRG